MATCLAGFLHPLEFAWKLSLTPGDFPALLPCNTADLPDFYIWDLTTVDGNAGLAPGETTTG